MTDLALTWLSGRPCEIAPLEIGTAASLGGGTAPKVLSVGAFGGPRVSARAHARPRAADRSLLRRMPSNIIFCRLRPRGRHALIATIVLHVVRFRAATTSAVW